MPNKKRPLVLTETDIALLQGLADGKCLADIGGELGISSWALRYRLSFIRKILPGTKTLINLVAEAIRKGHID
jgi:DNA-binding NarL/FixJ family response regulator